MIKKLDWEDIKFLGAVASHRTVRATAKQLNVHHSTVSRRIESLEHAAQTRLVFRTTEGYCLTEAGELLANSASVMDAEVSRAQRLIYGGDKELSGQLIVSMAEPVAVHAFAPKLKEFRNKYPKLEVSISSSNSMVDLSRQKADIAIRMSNEPSESLFGKRLFAYNNAVYASPEYESTTDLVNRPDDAIWIGWDGTMAKHPQWALDSEFPDVPVWGNFPDLEMQASLARSGIGIANLPCFIGDRDPGLVRVSKLPPTKGRDIWILTHSDLRNASRVRAFMKFAEKVLRDNKDYFEGSL